MTIIDRTDATDAEFVARFAPFDPALTEPPAKAQQDDEHQHVWWNGTDRPYYCRTCGEPEPAARSSADTVLRQVRELADELDREGVMQLFHGPSNRNKHITDRIRAALDPR